MGDYVWTMEYLMEPARPQWDRCDCGSSKIMLMGLFWDNDRLVGRLIELRCEQGGTLMRFLLYNFNDTES